jgi:hypothetical protein
MDDDTFVLAGAGMLSPILGFLSIVTGAARRGAARRDRDELLVRLCGMLRDGGELLDERPDGSRIKFAVGCDRRSEW